ncbi:hypothetical protein COLO4_10677 [Corchorus olitorius]|uniref:Uncharacterized protein n=1 Tax=Corchorus olitorius TaxID=93759 RepID=A0A1R3K7B4_9ROSI|nr:hypothetical protein COLO4_10677 [Corchorus olitorius]
MAVRLFLEHKVICDFVGNPRCRLCEGAKLTKAVTDYSNVGNHT